MLSKIFSQNVKDLFVRKKYQEVIKKIEEFSSIKERPAGLSNLIGVCKILKSQKKIRFSGITCHAGSQIFDIKIFEKIFRKMKKAVKNFSIK